MKLSKYVLILFSFLLINLNANEILNNSQQNILDAKKKKAKKQAELTKDSWISPLTVEVKKDRTKAASSNKEVGSQSIKLNISNDIFRSGAIDDTIEKGKVQLSINSISSKGDEKNLLSKVYGYVISLKKIDLQIKKTYYLVQNKEIEVKKNQDSYVNGIVDITVLDESVIELHNLENQKDDLLIQKVDILKDFKNYTKLDYKDIDLSFFNFVSIEEFMEKNRNIKIKKLEDKKSVLDRDITHANYLPKVTLNGSYGYEDGDSYTKRDDAYSYGVTISMPLDYNSNKNKEVAKLNRVIAKENLAQSQIDEKNFFSFVVQKLELLDNKISNIDKTIKRYKNLYENVNKLYQNSLKTIDDVHIMKNRLISNKLEKQILNLDKKLLLNILYKRI